MPKAKKEATKRSAIKPEQNKGFLPYRRHRSIKQHLFQILVILIALWAYKSYPKSSVNCKNPLDRLCPDKYFSDNYTSARNKFLSISSTIKNANTYNLPIYQLDTDEYLYTDITIINENSKSNHLLIHLSGTHGVEGHAGSAIQCGILEYISNITNNQQVPPLFENYTFDKNLQCNADNNRADDNNVDAPIIILVHALNPFGFHFGRRVNENNIDINRNYKTNQQWNELIKKDKNVFGYQDLDRFFNPTYDLKYMVKTSNKLPKSKFCRGVWAAWYYWTFILDGIYYLFSFGKSTIFATVVTGQWFDPKGLQYNGKPFKLEKSHEVLQDFLSNKLFKEKHPEWKLQINKISFIDVHTGLGSYGVDTLVTEENEQFEKLKHLMPNHAQNDLIIDAGNLANGAYKNVNGGTYQHMFDLVEFGMNKNMDEIDGLVAVQEFGTYDGIWVFAAMRYENGFTRSYNDYLEEKRINGEIENDVFDEQVKDLINIARKRKREVFYAEYVDWKTEIVKRGFNFFKQMFNR